MFAYCKSGNKCVCVISAFFAPHKIHTYFKTPKIHKISHPLGGAIYIAFKGSKFIPTLFRGGKGESD